MRKIYILYLLLLAVLFCCHNEEKADGYGNFETTETLVSAQANGQLLSFDINEGEQLFANQKVGNIDTTALSLQKQSLRAQQRVMELKKPLFQSQIAVLQAQLKTAKVEQKRVLQLLSGKATTQQKLDQVNGQVEVLQKKIANVRSNFLSIQGEYEVLQTQVDQVDDQIQKAQIVNPISGTVLFKLTEVGELIAVGKPLYRLADLSTLELKAYFMETQLSSIKLGQEVQVSIDETEGKMKHLKGTISWIASEAEFTPKTIQTKKERVNLVYAVKVRVKNDGALKIGMPAEVWL